MDIDSSAAVTLDTVAEELKKCGEVRMEIGGHTDSQGRDEMNLQLSQSRAEAVLVALMDRRVPVSNLSAKGYGESVPVGDNETEEGRETNRRIEFTLITDENADAADEAIAIEDGSGDGGGADGATSDEGARMTPSRDDGAEAGSGDGDSGSGDGEEGSGDGDGADTADAATDPESPSFAPDEKTIRPKARPKTE
ncbi:MAG: OmpA family protein [Paracoccaceae bacterium]